MSNKNGNRKKDEQLKMKHGTAAGRLRKKILFDLLIQLNQNVCYRCGEKIAMSSHLSIEHKEPWLDSEDPIGLYFDLGNIAFSHLTCNVGAARQHKGPRGNHGAAAMYDIHGCRCNKCRAWKSVKNKKRIRK